MYVGVTTMEVDPSDEARAESLRILEEQQLPLIRSAPGFLHQIVAAAADDHSRVVAIGLWDSEEAARAWESSGDFKKGWRAIRADSPQPTAAHAL